MKNSNLLFVHKIINNLANSIISIFIPILIYKQTGNLVYSVLFIAVGKFLEGSWYLVFKKILQRYPIICIVARIVPIVLEHIIILLIPNLNLWLIITLSVLNSLSSVFYYCPSNTIFSSVDKNANFAKFEAGGIVGRIIATLFSSLTLHYVSNPNIFLFIVSILLYFSSVIPLIICRNDINNNYINRQEIPLRTLHGKIKGYNLIHFLTGISSLFTEFLLPLYIYVVSPSFKVVGIFIVIMYALQILGNIVAHLVNKYKFVTQSCIVCSIAYIALFVSLIFVNVPYIIYIISAVIGFLHQVLFLSYFQIHIKEQKETGDFYNSIIWRGVYMNSGRSSVCCLFLLFPSFIFLFALGIGSGILYGASGIVMSKNENIKNNYTKNKEKLENVVE